MSGVTPESTTAKLAGDIPKEPSRELSTGSSDLPGAFPETPSNEISNFSVNPIPATSGIGNPVHIAPGEKVPDPSTLTKNTLSSTAHDDVSLSRGADDSEKAFGIAPLPATSGIGNPIHLQPGEKVPDPSTFTSNNINSTVRTDKESYENSSVVPQLPDVITPEKDRAANGGMFNLPGLSKNMIPESSLPMGGASAAEKDPGFTIQSAGAGTTTAALAGEVPLEPRGVPEVVRESQQEAGFAPEASSNREAVKEKTVMEEELESKVPLAPAIHEGTPHIQSAGEQSSTAALAGNVPLEPRGVAAVAGVPEVVKESQKEAGYAPEASANREAVAEKTEMERELESKVPEEQPIHSNTIQSAGVNSTTAALAGNVPLESRGVPEVVQESQQEAGFAPEASSNAEAVEEKFEVEKELESKVPEAPATSEGSDGHMGALVGGGVAAGGVAAAAAGYAVTKERPAEGSSLLNSRGLPASIQQSINEMNKSTPIASTVPDVVQESITESHQSPEAAASKAIVGEKSAMESELLHKVKPENDVGEPAPSASAALTETAPTATSSSTPAAAANATAKSVQAAEPSSNAAAAAELSGAKAFHAPLASTSTPAQPTFQSAMSGAVKQSQAASDSRDVSPMSHPTTTGQTQPAVTTGVGSSTAPQTSTASPKAADSPDPASSKAASSPNPAQSQAASSPNPSTVTNASTAGASTASTSTDKKAKRASGFFGRIKSRFSDKDKK